MGSFVRLAAEVLKFGRGMILIICVAAVVLAGCSQNAARVEAQTAPSAPLTYIGQWGAKGSGPGQLDDPTCITTDTLGNIYLADDGSHFVHKFGPDGMPHLSFEDPALRAPQSIAVDSGGAIYVTDASRGTVTIYLPSGIRLRSLRRNLRVNAENALDVAVDDDGRISVFDSEIHRVFTYTARFRLIREWQPAANIPNEHIRAAAMTGAPDGSLYFVDPEGNRILHFNSDGHFLTEIDAGANGSARKLSDQISASSQYVFAMDDDGLMLHVWSIDGASKTDVDLAPQLGQGRRPAPPIATSPRKELLVLDTPEGRVLRYRINF
ncbi:MAG: NHL repeat-containing protein [Candidatus Acidiferrales bacterium]